jgi:hypothetical protein
VAEGLGDDADEVAAVVVAEDGSVAFLNEAGLSGDGAVGGLHA